MIQIGWAVSDASVVPGCGAGVGDVPGSLSFDGVRACVRNWGGVEQNVLIVEHHWSVGDVVGCALDASRGIARWYLNGQFVGGEVTDLPTGLTWRAAVSLACKQQVEFNFGHLGFAFDPPNITIPTTNMMHFATDIDGSDVLEAHECALVELSPDDPLPAPLVYFEAWGFDSKGYLGIRTDSGTTPQARAYIRANNLYIGPDFRYELESSNSVVGCGVAVTQRGNMAFFVVDGTVLPTAIALVGAASHVALPDISSRFVRVNYGATRFVYTEANDSNTRAAMARSLIDGPNLL